MEFFYDVLESPIFWSILIFLLAITKDKRNLLLGEIATFAQQKVQNEAGNALVKQSSDLYQYTGEYPLVDNDKLNGAVQIIVTGLAGIFKKIDDAITSHTQSILSSFGNVGERSWKILGYIVQLILLIAFFLADIIQTLNSLAIFYPVEIAKISYILDFLPLPIAIVMASVGTALALGLIVSDFAGVTHFGDWNDLNGGYRIFIQILTYFTLLVAVSIAVIINLSKVVSIPDISATLSVPVVEGIKFWAGIAQNVVIFPLYSTTFLFFSGMKGFVVLYLLGVTLVNFISKILYGIVWIVTVLVMQGGTRGVELGLKIILLIVVGVLILFGSLFIGAGVIVAFLFTIIQKTLEIVFFPTDILFDKLLVYFTSSNSRS